MQDSHLDTNTCPHCHHKVAVQASPQEMQVEFCSRCGIFWLDFGNQRPGLYRAVEAQSARWHQQHRPLQNAIRAEARKENCL